MATVLVVVVMLGISSTPASSRVLVHAAKAHAINCPANDGALPAEREFSNKSESARKIPFATLSTHVGMEKNPWHANEHAEAGTPSKKYSYLLVFSLTASSDL